MLLFQPTFDDSEIFMQFWVFLNVYQVYNKFVARIHLYFEFIIRDVYFNLSFLSFYCKDVNNLILTYLTMKIK